MKDLAENKINLVSNAIMKWYEQTFSTITITVNPSSLLDVELQGILLVARKHTLGFLTTYANNHILPTHALLRVLIEIFGVLRWVFNVSSDDKERKHDQVYNRLRSWDLHRLNNDIAILKDLPESEEVKKALTEAEGKRNELKLQKLEEFPNIRDIFLSLGNEWLEVYAHYFRKYSRAVHLNRNTTQQLVWLGETEDKKQAMLYKEDIEPEGYELLDLSSVSADINIVIRDYYGWKNIDLQREYEELKSRLVN